MSEVYGNTRGEENPFALWLPVVAGLLIVYVPTFYDLARFIWVRDGDAHGPIILAVIVWLIWHKRRILVTSTENTAPAPGFALLAFGLLLYVAGRSQGIMIFQIASLIPVLAGTLLVLHGWTGLQGYAFMLLFLAYLLPVPAYFQDAVTMPLKQAVAQVAERIIYTFGYPVAHDGVIISIGQYQLMVADACSGLRSMFSLTAIGLLYLYLVRRRSWLHNAIILLCLLPIAFGANVIRVITLVLVTYHYGDAAGQGFVHGFSGMLLFLVSLVSVLVLDAILSRVIKSRAIAA